MSQGKLCYCSEGVEIAQNLCSSCVGVSFILVVVVFPQQILEIVKTLVSFRESLAPSLLLVWSVIPVIVFWFCFCFFFLKKKKEGEKKTSEEKLKNISEQGWAVLRVSFGNAFCSQSFSAEEALSLPRICSYVQEHMLLAADCCCLM